MKRITDKNLLKSYEGRPCIICGHPLRSPHHIKSVGSGGGDVKQNLMPVCHKHHMMIHQEGLNKCCAKFPQLGQFLVYWGWEFDEYLGKWILTHNNKGL